MEKTVFISDLLYELLSSFLDLLLVNVEGQQIYFNGSWNVFVDNICSFEFSDPRMTQNLSNSSH